MNDQFVSFCNELGIKQQLTQSYTPNNGIIESINRTFINKVSSMMVELNYLNHFWIKTFDTTSYIGDHCLIGSNSKITPNKF